MRKFKLYFYLLYLAFIIVAVLIAVYHDDMVLNWDWDPIDTWTGLIRLVLKLGAIGLILFIIEIIIENLHVFTMNKKIKSLEREVLDLKAKLYDQNTDVLVDEVQREESKEISDATDDEIKED